MHHPQIPSRYAHLVTGPWESSFLSNPQYVHWLDSVVSTQPIQPHERLVDYVRQRLDSSSPALSNQTRLRQSPLPSSSSPHPSFALSSSSSSHPHFSSATALPMSDHAMNGSSGVEFSDLIDYSALGEDGDSSASYGVPLEHSFPSTSNQGDARGSVAGSSSSAHFVNGYAAYAPPQQSSSAAISGYPPHSMSPSPFPPASTSSALSYSTIASPYGTAHPSQGPYYGSAPSVDPSFFAPPTSHQPSSSTLAMQSQLIQDERNRRNATMTISPASALMTLPSPVVSQPPPATTISPSMMTTSQFPSTTPTPVQPVASTSRASSAAAPSPPAKKVSTKSRSTTSASSSSSTSESIKRWNKVLPDVRANLSASRLSKAPTSTAQRLLSLLSPFNHVGGPSSTLSDWSDGSDVPPEGRKEVLTDLLKYASDEFWKAWVAEGDHGKENAKSAGVELLAFWFEGASRGIETKKDKMKEKEKESNADEGERKRRQVEQMTLALVLQVFGKIPITHRHLGNLASVAKRVRKISIKGDEGAVKAAATRLYDKWKKVQDDYNSTQQSAAAATAGGRDKKANGAVAPAGTRDSDSAKRKSLGSEEAPTKKAKTAATTGSTTKKATTPTGYAPVAATKLGANLSFKKKPESTMTAMRAALATVNKKDATNGATSSSSTPAASTTTGSRVAAAGTGEDAKKPSGKDKKKKSVRWKPDEHLEAIKWIEKAIYDDDEAQGKTGLGFGEGEEAEENFREMEQQEGMSLSMHLDEDEDMEEEIDWYEPVEVVIPDNEDFASLRQEPDSAEARIQAEREAQLMEVDTTTTPSDSPTEPPEYAPAVPDPESKVIPLSPELAADPQVQAEIAAAQAAAVPLGGFAANDQIESLLGQLSHSGILPPQTPQAPSAAPAAPLSGINPATLDALKGYDVEQIRQIIAAQPEFEGMTVENLGLLEGQQAPHGGYGPHSANPAHAYGQEPPAPYGANWGQSRYGTPAWNAGPAPQHDAYNGYVPPVVPQQTGYGHHGGHGAGAPPLGSHKNMLKRGKRKTLPCKFFKTNRGCDWGDKCAFIHDSS
ncbi:hypothetical protein JCM11491_003807 [Sporobolomyces phaffii]